MKTSLREERIIHPIRNNSNKKARKIRTCKAGYCQTNSPASTLSSDLYNQFFFLVKLAAVAQSRLQCNWFNLVLAESYTPQVKEAFMQCADCFVPFNYSSVHSNSVRAVNI